MHVSACLQNPHNNTTTCIHGQYILIHVHVRGINLIKGKGIDLQLDQLTQKLAAYTRTVKQTTSPVATGNSTATSTMVSVGMAGPGLVGSGSLGLEWSPGPVHTSNTT